MAQIGHELAHRWSTRTRAIVNGETSELRAPHDPWGMSGATHWPGSVTTPVPFPFSRPVEASIMGGTHWKDNGDGTFTQLANGTMNPASGFSYLELYLMGFLPASKVPDFFILRNQQNVGRMPEGQNIVKADKVTITIQDVIAHNGPRLPSFENSPKALTTAIVAVTLKGRQPAPAMLTQLEGIASAWKGYWSKVTGGVSTMSTSTGRQGVPGRRGVVESGSRRDAACGQRNAHFTCTTRSTTGGRQPVSLQPIYVRSASPCPLTLANVTGRRKVTGPAGYTGSTCGRGSSRNGPSSRLATTGPTARQSREVRIVRRVGRPRPSMPVAGKLAP